MFLLRLLEGDEVAVVEEIMEFCFHLPYRTKERLFSVVFSMVVQLVSPKPLLVLDFPYPPWSVVILNGKEVN